jgi:hypothetical protein
VRATACGVLALGLTGGTALLPAAAEPAPSPSAESPAPDPNPSPSAAAAAAPTTWQYDISGLLPAGVELGPAPAAEGGLLTADYVTWLNRRAQAFVASHADWYLTSYARRCPVLAANLNGYDSSDHATAYDWWLGFAAHGQAHLADTNPPAGALLFFAATSSNPAGHVAVYLGDGKIASNDIDSHGQFRSGGVGIFSVTDPLAAGSFASWTDPTYLGWTPPRFTSRVIAHGRPADVFAGPGAEVVDASRDSSPGSLAPAR